MKTLILTGWGWKDYACAGAVALRRHPDAELMGVSQRRLPEVLGEVKGVGQVIILGVGLAADPPLLARGLKGLAAKKTQVAWISTLPFPASVGAAVRDHLEIHVDDKVDNLYEAVGTVLGVPCDDLAPILQEDKPSDKAQKIQRLLDAAMYMYRNYQDEEAYPRAIRHIANGCLFNNRPFGYHGWEAMG
jgi:hypothetical protein